MQSNKLTSAITVIGAGSWGTALAILLARNGNDTRIWSNIPEELADMRDHRVNQKYLPDIPLPDKLTICMELEQAMQAVDDVLIVVPSSAFRAVLENLSPYFTANTRIAWATKGLDPTTDQLLHQVAQDSLGSQYPLAVLSGPSFALEVASGMPTAIAIAATSDTFAQNLILRCKSDNFRLEQSSDMVGVQLCGAVKNVLAIAAGIVDGLNYGANTQAALITLGLAEMTSLGIRLGANPETFIGLAGVGDLVLTCTDNQSRNRRFGLALGQGTSREQAEKEIGQVVEGAKNARQVHRMAKEHNVSMPICEQVYRIIYEDAAVGDIIKQIIDQRATGID